MRLALFTDTYEPQLNGVSRTLARLISEAESRGGVVRVFTPHDPRGARDRRPAVRHLASVRCPIDPQQLRVSLPSATRMAQELEQFQPTLVHCATPFGVGLAGRRAAAIVGVPLVTSYHTNFAAYAHHYGFGALSGALWQYLRWFHNAGRRTFCSTDAVRCDLQAHGFERLAIWGRGVDASRFNPDQRSRAMRLRIGATDDRLVVSYVGRIAREKGLDGLLLAMSRIRQATDHVTFAFAGDGPYLDHCRRHAPVGTAFLGRLDGDALAAFYASSDLLVFPSSIDTFGNALIEAMASGIAIVAGDCASTREITGATAVLYDAPDAGSLEAAITSLMLNAPRRLALARAGRIRSGRFSWSVAFRNLFAEYEAAVSAPSAGRPAFADRTPLRAVPNAH